tara:strand:+ start:430 stop:651 length:222 start_codon:yes stop_codon:yes gene_type:complete
MDAKTYRADADYPNPWAIGLNFCHVFHAWQLEWCHMWAHQWLPSLYPPHPHVGHHQLEIPDPLAEAKEPELFA